MNSCILCHSDISDIELSDAKPVPGGLACRHCISELMKLLPRPKVERGIRIPDPGPYCYRVEYNGFVTMVDSRDASNEEAAKFLAGHDTLQAWYGIPHTKAIPVEDMTVTKLSHDQYVDWIRRS